MALNSTDLFVVQSQADSKLYKLSLNDLQASVEGGAGINFRGSVDLLSTMSGQIEPDPPLNGDLYLVEQDAPTINVTWSMADGVTAANENDRIVWNGDTAKWVLIQFGNNTGGTLTGIVGTDPIKVDSLSDPTQPVISIDEATTTDNGVVARLATAADVAESNDSPPIDAVVTADLLNATNKALETLTLAPGGVLSVATDDVNSNDALTISPNAGAVKVEINTGSTSEFGVVGLADAAAIAAGTGGSSNVIDASALKTVADSIPETADFGILTIAEGGTDIVSGALDIQNTSGDVTIGIKDTIFVPVDFNSLPDITA